MEKKYAELLVDYCLEIKEGDLVFVHSTPLAAPLLKEVFRLATRRGALVEMNLSLEDQLRIFFEEADHSLIDRVSPVQKYRFENYDKYLHIRAPYNLAEDKSIPANKLKQRGEATKEINQLYFDRTADGSLDRCLCEYPTHAAAQNAGMSLEEYRKFVFEACRLFDDSPIHSWRQVRKEQQKYTDYLNQSEEIHYLGPNIDIRFSCMGRIWINSDGRANMPSGEVFTAPVEDSVEGTVHFSYPAIYRGQEVSGISLRFEKGLIVDWTAEKGQSVLDEVFDIPGARRLGEAAIGTNYQITRMTRNILFDEKIGGTIHLAIGQAYKQNKGKNNSAVHWDMITDMTNDSQITADGKTIYENGYFIL